MQQTQINKLQEELKGISMKMETKNQKTTQLNP